MVKHDPFQDIIVKNEVVEKNFTSSHLFGKKKKEKKKEKLEKYFYSTFKTTISRRFLWIRTVKHRSTLLESTRFLIFWLYCQTHSTHSFFLKIFLSLFIVLIFFFFFNSYALLCNNRFSFSLIHLVNTSNEVLSFDYHSKKREKLRIILRRRINKYSICEFIIVKR